MSITTRVVRRARRKYGVKVYHHKAWGSKARGVYAQRRKHRPVNVLKADTLVQHITVTLDTGPLAGDFHRDMQTVERIGLERFGSGVSYNFVVDMQTGEVAVGMPLDAKGTHTVNDKRMAQFSYDQNHAARAIAVLGVENDKLSPKAERAIAGLIAAMVDEGALTDGFDYMPHSFFAWKDCPCDATRNRMAAIRAMAFKYRDAVKTRPKVPGFITDIRRDLEEARHRVKIKRRKRLLGEALDKVNEIGGNE